ncbi:MAG: hypothetical protein PHQ64_01005 [Bacilli bacterium]|nr:hypothetical protein [Bacilli bacterium]
MKEYLELCKDKLLYEICELLGIEKLTEDNDNDYIWSIVTSTLLHNEKLCGEEKIEQYLDSLPIAKSIESHILRYALDTSCVLDTDRFKNYFLDNDNKFSDYNSFDKYTFLTEQYILEDKDNYLSDLDISYGSNSAIITDELLDYKKLIKRVRNSLAHSNYEIVNDDQIRLYHYDDNNVLDFNVLLCKPLVITIIDEINEKSYNLYSNLLDELGNYNTNNKESREINDKDIQSYLDEYKFLTEKDKLKIIRHTYNWIKENQITNKYLVYDRLDKAAFVKIKNTYNSALVLDSLIVTNYNSDPLYSDYLYHRYGVYEYSSFDIRTFAIYKEEKLRLLLISLLNVIFLYGSNTSSKVFDLSLVETDSKFVLKKEKAFIKEKEEKQREIDNIKTSINTKKEILKDKYIDNEYFNKILPEVISSLEIKIIEKESSFPNFKEINVLAHIRNSLAHGNTIYNHNKQELIFKDYDPFTHKLTYLGKISIENLFILLKDNGIISGRKAVKKLAGGFLCINM